MVTAGLVLAAGCSRRMGDFKPLMQLGGHTLLAACLQSLRAGGVTQATVVLGHRAAEVRATLVDCAGCPPLRFAENRAYAQTDMLASIQLGLRHLPPCDAFYLLPGDMPAVRPQTFRALAEALSLGSEGIAFPLLNGRRKHPPLIRARCIGDILAHQGADGLRSLWQAYAGQTLEVPTDDSGCGMDADTAEDFERLGQYMRRNGLPEAVAPCCPGACKDEEGYWR